MDRTFSTLERNILKAKGASDVDIDAMVTAGVAGRDDFRTVGDAATLCALVPALSADVAAAIMSWAVGAPVVATPVAQGPVVVDSADVVYCVHCKARQPKDYKSGDLCVSCGRQAEPILACFWCSSSGPGKYCRSCGAEFIATAELDLAILLKREGLAKDEIPRRLRAMEASEKDALWGRVRRSRG